jgi:hypothetical protein
MLITELNKRGFDRPKMKLPFYKKVINFVFKNYFKEEFSYYYIKYIGNVKFAVSIDFGGYVDLYKNDIHICWLSKEMNLEDFFKPIDSEIRSYKLKQILNGI